MQQSSAVVARVVLVLAVAVLLEVMVVLVVLYVDVGWGGGRHHKYLSIGAHCLFLNFSFSSPVPLTTMIMIILLNISTYNGLLFSFFGYCILIIFGHLGISKQETCVVWLCVRAFVWGRFGALEPDSLLNKKNINRGITAIREESVAERILLW